MENIIRFPHEFTVEQLRAFTRVKLVTETRDGIEVWYEVHLGQMRGEKEEWVCVWACCTPRGIGKKDRAGSPKFRGLAQTQEKIAADWRERILEAGREP